MAKRQIGFHRQAEEDEQDVQHLPDADLSDIGKIFCKLFEAATDFTDTDMPLTTEQVEELLRQNISGDFKLSDMVAELIRLGYKQEPAGGNLFWLLKKI